MAYWLDTGRRAIFESLAEVCDKIDDGLKAGTLRHHSFAVPVPYGPLTRTVHGF